MSVSLVKGQASGQKFVKIDLNIITLKIIITFVFNFVETQAIVNSHFMVIFQVIIRLIFFHLVCHTHGSLARSLASHLVARIMNEIEQSFPFR